MSLSQALNQFAQNLGRYPNQPITEGDSNTSPIHHSVRRMVASLSPGLVSGLPPSPSVPAPSAGVWSPSCASIVPSVSLSASICPPPIIRVCRSARAPVPCAPSPASLGPCDARDGAQDEVGVALPLAVAELFLVHLLAQR